MTADPTHTEKGGNVEIPVGMLISEALYVMAGLDRHEWHGGSQWGHPWFTFAELVDGGDVRAEHAIVILESLTARGYAEHQAAPAFGRTGGRWRMADHASMGHHLVWMLVATYHACDPSRRRSGVIQSAAYWTIWRALDAGSLPLPDERIMWFIERIAQYGEVADLPGY